MKTQVTSTITIEINDQKFDLSPQEARALRDKLNDALNDKPEIRWPTYPRPVYMDHPVPVPGNPFKNPTLQFKGDQITCQTRGLLMLNE